MLDRPTAPAIDYRSVNARAVRHFALIFHECVDLRGKPLSCVLRLGNPDIVLDPGKSRPSGQPRLVNFQGPGINGSWKNLGPPSAEGKDLVEWIEWLGSCDRRTAGEFLRSLVDRIVVVETTA